MSDTQTSVARLLRGVASDPTGRAMLHTTADLARKLSSGRPLRIKLGMDPTAPDLHLGHTVVLKKLRQFQDLGHVAVLIIGDYTARIGDPTGRDTTRPVLTAEAIDANARTYLEQAGRVLDLSPGKFEVRRNSEWLSSLSFADVLRLTGLVTVQRMLERDMFQKRMSEGREIMVSEFMYPIMQAYDSVMVKADVELGGTDQLFNNMAGRDLMGKMGMDPQVVMVMPILRGLDGREKMSKSKGNYVAVAEDPHQMFGKLMSIPDGLMPDYYRLLTDLPEDRIVSLTDGNLTHPRQAKDAMARVIVEEFLGAEAANAASEEFRRRFSEGALPSEIEVKVVGVSPIGIVSLLSEVGFASSNSDARRLVAQSAVTWDGATISDPKQMVEIPAGAEVVLKVGKRRVCKVRAK